jgi:hypothetical protein
MIKSSVKSGSPWNWAGAPSWRVSYFQSTRPVLRSNAKYTPEHDPT